jgi:hypothetical protein
MRRKGVSNAIAAGLLVVGILFGVSGYYVATTYPTRTVTQTETTTASLTTTETVIKTYTITTTLAGESGLEQCVVTEYHVWAIEEMTSSSTIQATSTQSYAIRTYQTSTSVEQPVGFETTTTATYTGTLTGAIAIWNSTTCTFISG